MEQHNSEVQQSFSQRMEGALGLVQRCVQQHGAKHHDMLSSYSHAIGETGELQGSDAAGTHRGGARDTKGTFSNSVPLHFPRADGVLVMNEAALKGALTTVESFVGGVGQLVAEGVTRCRDRVQQQEALCVQDKEGLLQLLVRTRTTLNMADTIPK